MPPWLTFILLTFALSAPLYFLLLRRQDVNRDSLDRAVRQLMWVPGIAAFAILARSGEGFSSLDLGPGRYPLLLPAALLLPLLMEFLLIFAAVRLGLGQVDGSIFGTKDGWVYLSPSVRLVLGHEKQAPLKFAVNILLTVAIAAALTLIFSFAEELGWRGYLQDRITDRLTLTWGLVVSGLFWGLWYAPAVLKGYLFPAYPRLGAFAFMPIFTISAGIVAGWLYWLSGSLWAAAIFNASLKVSSRISEVALGDAGSSRRVRIVWLWLWAVLAGLALTVWYAGI